MKLTAALKKVSETARKGFVPRLNKAKVPEEIVKKVHAALVNAKFNV